MTGSRIIFSASNCERSETQPGCNGSTPHAPGGERRELRRVYGYPTRVVRGGGWTPEYETTLFKNLRARGVRYLGFEDLCNLSEELDQVKRDRGLKTFNDRNWGLAQFDLPEVTMNGSANA